MVESKIVDLVVAGSKPVIHPVAITTFKNCCIECKKFPVYRTGFRNFFAAGLRRDIAALNRQTGMEAGLAKKAAWKEAAGTADWKAKPVIRSFGPFDDKNRLIAPPAGGATSSTRWEFIRVRSSSG